ncbi:MAG: hypothetical protein ACYDCK_14765 [Thermoplasmatota archaeon]
MAITTIQVKQSTRRKLAKLKAASGHTYDELLMKLLALVPEGDDEGQYTDAFRWSLLEAHLDIKAGRLVPHDRIKRELGLK